MATTEELLGGYEKELERAALDKYVAHFLKTWKPVGHQYDEEQFTYDLISLIRRIMVEAQTPLLKALTDMASRSPMIYSRPPYKTTAGT